MSRDSVPAAAIVKGDVVVVEQHKYSVLAVHYSEPRAGTITWDVDDGGPLVMSATAKVGVIEFGVRAWSHKRDTGLADRKPMRKRSV